MNGNGRLAGSCALGCILWASQAWAVDSDGDGVDDAVDVCCETPSGVEVDKEGRPIGDVDGDCDVDLADYRFLQNNLTGPLAVGCCFDAECDDGDPCTVDSCDGARGVCEFHAVPNCSQCTVPPECGTEIECDVPIDGTTSSPLETDYFCFCVSEGEMVRVSVVEQAGSGPSYAPSWRLVDSHGNPASACGTAATAVTQSCGPLPAAGNPYRLEIDDAGHDDVGNYRAHLQRLTAQTACENVEVSCDVPITLSIENTADTDLVSFDVSDEETVHISMVKLAGSGANFNPNWRLIDRAGNPARSCGAFSTLVTQDCGPLPGAGNPYRIDVEDGARNDIGSYSVHLQRLSFSRACEGIALLCDAAVTTTIDHVADTDLFPFRVAEGEIVRISVVKAVLGSAPNFGPSWRLLDGAGHPAVSCGGLTSSVSLDCGPLPVLGNPYRLEVEDGGRNEIGTYSAYLQRLTAVRACDSIELQCGVGHTGTIDHIADSDLLQFEIVADETVRIGVSKVLPSLPNFNPNWRLLDGAGNPALACGTFTTTESRDCGLLPAARNPYRVEVEDGSRNDTGTYEVTVQFLTHGCP